MYYYSPMLIVIIVGIIGEVLQGHLT